MRGRLKAQQVHNLRKLLDMLYTPAELASTVGFTRRQIYRVYVPEGLPCQRDETGHLWINGCEFRNWYRTNYKKTKLGPNETYCLTCKGPVPIYKPQTFEKGGMIFIQSFCPHCGRKLARFQKNLWKK
ncbi:MAG: division plane positioning ATPase MipZ [Anaerolineaceae bacterium]|nr:division plane positioning ATPase MipZ [Anaerolineaceae bacterium]